MKRSHHGKSRLDLVPPKALLAVGHVLGAGAEKHGEWTWRDVDRDSAESKFLGAALRHLMRHHSGDGDDKGTGQPHLACAASNLLLLLDIVLEGRDGERASYRGKTIEVKQEFRAADPDRVWIETKAAFEREAKERMDAANVERAAVKAAGDRIRMLESHLGRLGEDNRQITEQRNAALERIAELEAALSRGEVFVEGRTKLVPEDDPIAEVANRMRLEAAAWNVAESEIVEKKNWGKELEQQAKTETTSERIGKTLNDAFASISKALFKFSSVEGWQLAAELEKKDWGKELREAARVPGTRLASKGSRREAAGRAAKEWSAAVADAVNNPTKENVERCEAACQQAEQTLEDMADQMRKADFERHEAIREQMDEHDGGPPKDDDGPPSNEIRDPVKERGRLRKRIRHLEGNHVRLNAEIRKRDKRIAELEACTRMLESHVEQSGRDVRDRDKRIEELEAQLQAAEVPDGFQSQLRRAREDLADGQGRRAQLEMQLNKAEAALSSEVRKRNERIAELERQLDKIGAANEYANELEVKLDQRDKRIAELEVQLKQTEGAGVVEAHRNRLRALRRQITELEVKLNATKSEVFHRDERIAELERKLKDAEGTGVIQLMEMVTDRNHQIDTADKRIDDLDESLSKSIERIAELEAQLDEALGGEAPAPKQRRSTRMERGDVEVGLADRVMVEEDVLGLLCTIEQNGRTSLWRVPFRPEEISPPDEPEDGESVYSKLGPIIDKP